MGLQLVSETYQEDTPNKGPAHAPVSPLTPPVNLADTEPFVKGQPFDAFKTMREQAPVMWHPIDTLQGFWALTRYDDIREVNLDTKRFSSQKGGILQTYGTGDTPRHPLLHRASLDTMICLDQPHHMQLRMEHMHYFKPGFVAELKAKVDLEVTRLIDEMVKHGPVLDMVEHFSQHLPLFTLCEMLGVPVADRPKFIHWMHFLETAGYRMQQEDLGNVDPAEVMEFLTEVQNMFDYGMDLLKKRRANPQNDLLSAIANVEIDGEKLPDEYLDGSWLLIVFAGNDTTRNSLSGTMKLLTQNPEQKAQLIADPELIPNMVHEAIRMVSPVMYMRRTATQDTEVNGQKIAEGEKLVMYFGAANRDPDVFENPDAFDIHRKNAKDHLAFGIGPHVCIGQRVANMQLEAAYRQLLARFPDAKWTGKEEIAPNNFVHAISSLEIDLGTG